MRDAVAGRVPISVALGELAESDGAWDASRLAGFRYAKLGLAGCGTWPDWQRRWDKRIRQFAPRVTPVAVIYADWHTACAGPRGRPGCGGRARLRSRVGGHVRQAPWRSVRYFDEGGLIRLVDAIRRHGLLAVLGGSLGAVSMRRVWSAGADYLAVREPFAAAAGQVDWSSGGYTTWRTCSAS